MRRRHGPTTHAAYVSIALSMFASPALTASAAAVALHSESATDIAIRELHGALSVHPRGLHLHRLFGLRQLRDPKLAPLFLHLLSSSDWTVQVHGILGLLELCGRSNGETYPLPELFADRHPLAQEAALANALDQGLIKRDQLHLQLDLPALAIPARLLAMAETKRLNGSFLADTHHAEEDHIAVLASLLLLEAGDDAALSTLRSRLSAREGGYRHRLLIWTLNAIRQYRLTGALAFVEGILAAPPVALDVEFAAVRTLAAIHSSVLNNHIPPLLSRRETIAHRTRCALILLEAQELAPLNAWTLFPEDDLTLRTMRLAGEAMIRGRDVAAALSRLAELQHPLITPWLLAMSRSQPTDTARSVLLTIIDRTLADQPRGDGDAALQAIGMMLRIDPQSVIARLSAADDDSPQQELLLLGALGADHPDIGRTVAGIRRIGVARADALALLLHARYTDELGGDDARRLELIAIGGIGSSPSQPASGGLSTGLRTQAAWLHLRHQGNASAALSSILANLANTDNASR